MKYIRLYIKLHRYVLYEFVTFNKLFVTFDKRRDTPGILLTNNNSNKRSFRPFATTGHSFLFCELEPYN